MVVTTIVATIICFKMYIHPFEQLYIGNNNNNFNIYRRDKRKAEAHGKSPQQEMAMFGGRDSLWFGDAYEEESNMDISECLTVVMCIFFTVANFCTCYYVHPVKQHQ